MPSETHDAAAAYIVEYGVLRASNTSAEWINLFKGDLMSMLIAISRQASGLIANATFNQESSVMFIQSPVETDFKIVCDATAQGDPSVYVSWATPGANHRFNFINNFNLSSRQPIYWAIYKTGTKDIGVTLARDTSSGRLPESPSSYTPPTDDQWLTIKDNLCYFTPCSFYIAHVMDSLRNRDGYGAIIIPTRNNGMGNQVKFVADQSIETGAYIDSTTSNYGRAVLTYYTPNNAPQTNQDIGMGGITMLCGDTCYYPLRKTTAPYTPLVCSTTAPMPYIAPAWHPCTACVCTDIRVLYWGQMIKHDSYESPTTPRLGPQVEGLGPSSSQTNFLWCFEVYIPAPSQEPEEEE